MTYRPSGSAGAALIRLFPAALLLAGCSYDPPIRVDHNAPKYRADLARCDAEAAKAASQVTGATPGTFLASPFTYLALKQERIRACMTRRGYVIEG